MPEGVLWLKVCIVGLGQIGFPVAQYVHLKGHEVYGYDINPRTVENTIKTGHFAASDVWENVPAADVFVVCVTTGQVDNCPDLNAVFDVCRKSLIGLAQIRWLALKAPLFLEPAEKFSRPFLIEKCNLYMRLTGIGLTNQKSTVLTKCELLVLLTLKV